MSSTLTNLTAATTWSGTDLFYMLVGGNSRKVAASSFWTCEAINTLSDVNSTNAQTVRVYRTFTDSSNYERLTIQSGSGYFELKAETAGTGTDNLEFRLASAGTGGVVISRNLVINPGTGLTAGGSADTAITISSAGSFTFGIYSGSGVPTVSAGQGSLYLRSDGSSNVTRMYVNTNGSTTWTAVNTVA